MGLKIKRLREEHKMSQTTLAEKIGYKDKTAIAKVEAGKVDLPQSKISAFAKALDTTPAYLMGWENIEIKKTELFCGLEGVQSDKLKTTLHSMLMDENYSINKNNMLNRMNLYLQYFMSLNSSGQDEALKRIEELTFIPKYSKNENAQKEDNLIRLSRHFTSQNIEDAKSYIETKNIAAFGSEITDEQILEIANILYAKDK
ncbi:MAG: helix-turn-helix transcriptional regulator [Firmicutes bacterium]|nr:helix-turn-helix transcriptional regulator [Bacillota bacterium]